jgi:hypothetical protein
VSVFHELNALRDELERCQDNSLLRAGFYASPATSAVGHLYMGNGAGERNGSPRTDIQTHPASGTPIRKNSGSQLRFTSALFFVPNSLFQRTDLLFHDSNLLLQRLYSHGFLLPSGSRCALTLLPVPPAIRLIHEDMPHFLTGHIEESAFLIGLCREQIFPNRTFYS